MDTVGRALAKEFPVENAGETVRLIAMREYGLRELRPAMVVLLAIVGDVMRLVVGHGMSWTLGGLVVGLAASIGVLRRLQELLFGVTPTDPFVLAAVSLLLLVVAFAASYLPARRALGVDPVTALRSQ